ncbi:g7106 [Coccomyxa elongata]
MELPGKASVSQEVASPQSLPPTPKRRSSRITENFNPNAFPGIPEDPAALEGKWHTSHNTAADLSRKADFRTLKEVQQAKTPDQEIKESTESDISSTAVFDVFSPADWKHQSLRDAGAVPALMQGLRKAPLPSLEEEPLSEAAPPQDKSSPVHKPHNKVTGRKGHEQPWQGMPNHISDQASRAENEQQQGTATAEQPRAPKQTSISLQALARVHQPGTRGEATAANRAGGTAASRAGTSVGAEHTAQEYQRPVQKPQPIRTGLEAHSYPCYIEILQKARLRPERPPGAPPRRRSAQPTAGLAAETGPIGGRAGGAKPAPRPNGGLPVKKGDKVVQATQQAKYAALAASRQALEVKRGQGRPQLRTEQRSAEKIAAVSPLAARQNHRTASAVNAAALLAENQRRLETRNPAQLRRAGGRENDAPTASKQQEAAGYAKLQRPNAAVAARLPRPAFRPSGTNGWRLGQPTNSVGEDLGYGTTHARAMAAHGRACRESEAKVAAAKSAALQAERLREKAQRAVEEQAERALAERLRKRLLLSSDYTLQERLEWASNPDDTRSLHSKLLASSSGRCAPVSLRSSWELPAGGASGKQGASSGAARHLFPREPLLVPHAESSGAAGRKRTRGPEASPAEQQVYDMSAIRAGRLGLSSSSEPRVDRDQTNAMADTPRSHVSDTVLTGSGPLCDITNSSNSHNRSDENRSELADKEQQEDSPDAVEQALARAEAQSERGSGLHCNPIFADALHRSQQEVQNLLEKEAVRCIFIQDNPTFDSLRCSLGLPRSHLTSASQPSDCQLALQGDGGQAKQRPAYAMLGRMEVPGGAAGADPERRVAADAGGHSEQPSPGRASASREVYILAAADAVEDALNSHRVMEQERAEAEAEGARSQSVFNSSLSFLGKDYAPLENSLSAHAASPNAGPNNGEVQSKRAEAATLSLDWRPANAPLTCVCEAGWSPAAAAFQGQTSTVGDSQVGSAETQTSVTEGARRRVHSSKWSWLSRWACLAHAPAVHP